MNLLTGITIIISLVITAGVTRASPVDIDEEGDDPFLDDPFPKPKVSMTPAEGAPRERGERGSRGEQGTPGTTPKPTHNMMSIAIDEAKATMADTSHRMDLLRNIIEEQLYDAADADDHHESFKMLTSQAKKLTKQLCKEIKKLIKKLKHTAEYGTLENFMDNVPGMDMMHKGGGGGNNSSGNDKDKDKDKDHKDKDGKGKDNKKVSDYMPV